MRKPFYQDVIIAGFGGQGVMLIGRLLAYSAMMEGRETTWIPSYGVEMRGGVANCTVVVSSDPIGSPVITYPQSAIVMNQPSFDTFEPRVKKEGILVMNRSLIKPTDKRNDITTVEVPANEIAMELGNNRVANMVMLGAYIASTKVVSKNNILQALRYILGEERENILKVNEKAFERGERLVESLQSS